ncbi:MAG: hypothetical protein QGH25_24100, partial [Candidatus Latescibacteria bacterium]|nr:hypothetical protein [Candidatus Latescibacterota bacterium]
MDARLVRFYHDAPSAHPVGPHYFDRHLFDNLDNTPKCFAALAHCGRERDAHQIPIEGLADISDRYKDIGLAPGARNESESPGVDLE